MYYDKIKNLLKEYHKPLLEKESRVIIVFADGEMICTKGGNLFGERSLHQIAVPFMSDKWIKFQCETMPLGVAGAIVTEEEGKELRRKLWEIWYDLVKNSDHF